MIVLLSLGLRTSSTMADLKERLLLMLKLKLPSAEIEYVAFYFHKYRVKILPAFSFIEAHGTGKYQILLIMAITDTRIKVPPLAIH
jgi:hypothetical protein